jgi:hypothetical protein
MEILYTYSYMQSNGGDLFLGAFGGIAGIALLIGLIVTWKNNSKIEKTAFGIITLALVVSSFSILIPTVAHPTIEHDVLISDMSKFDANKYKIIEQKGKIFKVKEIR